MKSRHGKLKQRHSSTINMARAEWQEAACGMGMGSTHHCFQCDLLCNENFRLKHLTHGRQRAPAT
jgi:hypothetical protein